MHLLVLNGNPDLRNMGWESRLADWVKGRESAGHTVERRDLRDMDIRFCTGCFSCWLKTPGLCAFKDDMTELYPRILAADVVVWASPMIVGNVSALVKKAQDRFIPLIHPYIELDGGECHHRRRYPKDIDFGVILGTGPEDAEEDVGIVMYQMERLARNARGKLCIREVMDIEAAAVCAPSTGKEAVRETIGA
jgi:hypothetical protein